MKNYLIYKLALCLGLFVCSGFVQAQENNGDVYVPEILQPWVAWVLEKHPQISCPQTFDGSQLDCGWIREINLHLKSGTTPTLDIQMQVDAFADTQISLPDTEAIKPRNVRVDGVESAIAGGNGKPRVFLSSGIRTIQLELTWEQEFTPEFINLPSAGIINFRIDDQKIVQPELTNYGTRLWLTKHTDVTEEPAIEPDESDSQRVRVFRSLDDDVPQILVTYIHITVTGRSRVLELGQVLPEGFVATNLSTDNPARLGVDGNLSVTVEAGTNFVILHARSEDQINQFSYTRNSEFWPAEEVWAVEPNPLIRVIRMEGPRRTNLEALDIPREFAYQSRGKSGFLLTDEIDLEFIEEQRGDVKPTPTEYFVDRELWLDFTGESFIAKDTIRLDSFTAEPLIASYAPGSVKVDRDYRLLTYHDPAGKRYPGITLADEVDVVEAVSQIANSHSLRAVGWEVEAQTLRMTMHLPPGWMMLWSQGADQVENSWVSNWTVGSIFVALLLLILVFRLGGVLWASILAFTILLSYPYSFEAMIGWIVLASVGLLLRFVRSSLLQKFLRIFYWVVLVVVSVMTIYTAALLARDALYPRLSHDQSYSFMHTFTTELNRNASADFHAYTAQDVAATEAATMDDFFRKIPQQFNSTNPQLSYVEEVVATGSRLPGASTTKAINVQTGPGTPTWQNNSVMLAWNGAVSADQNLNVLLLQPWVTRPLLGIAALLMGTVALFFLLVHVPQAIAQLPKVIKRVVSIVPCLLVLGLLMNSSENVTADIPDNELLKELEQRLLAGLDCEGECAYLEHATITTDPEQLEIKLRIHAVERVAIPLPTSKETWQVSSIARGEEDIPLIRKRNILYTVLDKGIHEISIVATIGNLNRLDFFFSLLPSFITLNTDGWSAEGIRENQLQQSSFSLTKILPNVVTNETNPEIESVQYIFPYVSVTREIYLDYEPGIETTVERIAPHQGEFSVRVPLLPNESVTIHNNLVDGQDMVIDFTNTQTSFMWTSEFDASMDLQLTSPDLAERTEIWSIRTSEFWLLDYDGLTPIQSEDELTSFIPLSNETLALQFSRPTQVPGQFVTVERAQITMAAQERNTRTLLHLQVNATQTDELTVELPDDAAILGVLADNEQLPIPPSTTVLLPINLGLNSYLVEWKTDTGVKPFQSTPAINLSHGARNVNYSVSVPQDRWVIWTGGLMEKPDVLTWIVALGLVVIGLGLVRIPNIELSTTEVIVLAIGAALTSTWIFFVIGIWKLLIWLRARNLDQTYSMWLYRTTQVALALVGIATAVFVVYLVANVLIGTSAVPAASQTLSWFADEIGESLPVVWLFSVPQWVYLVLILAWSLWLALVLVRWAREAWTVLTHSPAIESTPTTVEATET